MDISPRARWQLAAFGNPADLRDDLRRLCDFGHWATGGAAVIGVPPSGAAFATYAGRPLARERTLAKVRANFILTCAPHRRGTAARGAIPRQHQHKVIRDVGAIADIEAGIRTRPYTALTLRPVAKWKICRRAIGFSLTALYNPLRSSDSFARVWRSANYQLIKRCFASSIAARAARALTLQEIPSMWPPATRFSASPC